MVKHVPNGPTVQKLAILALAAGIKIFWAKRPRLGNIIWVLRIFLYKTIFLGVYSKNGEMTVLQIFRFGDFYPMKLVKVATHLSLQKVKTFSVKKMSKIQFSLQPISSF